MNLAKELSSVAWKGPNTAFARRKRVPCYKGATQEFHALNELTILSIGKTCEFVQDNARSANSSSTSHSTLHDTRTFAGISTRPRRRCSTSVGSTSSDFSTIAAGGHLLARLLTGMTWQLPSNLLAWRAHSVWGRREKIGQRL